MCTKHKTDGDVHLYFSPYDSPHEAYIYYMNILSDFRERLDGSVSFSGPLTADREFGPAEKPQYAVSGKEKPPG